MGDDDSPALHARDTLARRRRPVRRAAVRVLVEDGPRYVRELMDWGARFDRDAEAGRRSAARRRTASAACCTPATPPAARSAACCGSRSRALRADHDHRPRARHRLLVEDGRCVGARVSSTATERRHEVARRRRRCWPRAAPGRCSRRRPTRRSRPATASRWRSTPARGSPTSSSCSSIRRRSTCPGAPRFLISEALRGEGARLVNARGEAFMTRYHPAGDLAPRDRRRRAHRARAPSAPAAPSSCPRASAIPTCTRRFPTIAETCRAGRPRSRPRPDSGRPGRALRHGRRRHRLMAARRCPGSSPPAKWRAPACTAPTGSPATRCSRGWCSARAPGAVMGEAPRQPFEPWGPGRLVACDPVVPGPPVSRTAGPRCPDRAGPRMARPRPRPHAGGPARGRCVVLARARGVRARRRSRTLAAAQLRSLVTVAS